MLLQLKKTYEILTVVVLLLCSGLAWAADSPRLKMQESEELNIILGKSMVLTPAEPVKRISIGNPEIADFILVSPTEIYIYAKSVGVTSITLWKNKDQYRVYNLVVSIDVSQLKKTLNEFMPDEKELRVSSHNGHVTLSGTVSSITSQNKVLTLTRSYVPGEKINNLLEVGSVHQVMLEVRIAEMQRSLMKRIGINFDFVTSSGHFGINKLGNLATYSVENDSITRTVSSAVNALFNFTSGNVTWTAFIDAMKSDGLIKILAEPNLIALSGQEASFLAGGEFPVPAPQGLGSVAIDYKSFGVGLTFKPIVLDGDKINIDVAPEVSELDYTNALQTGGYVVPGLSTRRTSTAVQLADGQSFAIAGLLKSVDRDAVEKFPVLGDVPVLGALFRSRSYQNSETELVIIVTPHLVKPLDMDEQALPTDNYTAPDDMEFYILGQMKNRDMEPAEEAEVTVELDGDFGHAIPGAE